MILMQPSFHHFGLSAGQEGSSSLPIPMVYEHLPAPQLSWEYHILSIDASEQELPQPEQLNSLGREGWVLVSVLDERASGRGSKVHYYFTRQASEQAK